MITAPCATLGPALAFVRDIIPAKPPVPILKSIFAEAVAGAPDIVFRATDLDIDAYATAPAVATPGLDSEASAIGGCAIDGRLAALVSGLPKDAEVTLSVDGDTATLQSGRSRYRLPVLPAAEFPPPLAARFDTEPHVAFELAAADTIELLRPLLAASDETARYYLCGIHIHLDDTGNIISVATDGHTLVRVTLPAPLLTGSWPATSVIVPTRAAELIAKLAKGCGPDGLIAFRISGLRIDCAANGLHRGVTSKLIDGMFPDYRAVLPRGDIASTADVGAAALLQALERLAAISKIEAAGITWSDGDAAVTLTLPHTAEAAEDIVAATTTGAAGFGVSTSKLRELVSKITGKTVTFQFFAKGGPIVITAGDPRYYSLVMPMRV